jgi:hypothetical protein
LGLRQIGQRAPGSTLSFGHAVKKLSVIILTVPELHRYRSPSLFIMSGVIIDSTISPVVGQSRCPVTLFVPG